MNDTLLPVRTRLSNQLDHQAPPEFVPLAADSWIVSSLLQKSIRRGNVKTAQRSALTLARLRGTREPITVMVPLVWLAANVGQIPTVTDISVAAARAVGDVPLYALDMHTRSGREAIHRFAQLLAAAWRRVARRSNWLEQRITPDAPEVQHCFNPLDGVSVLARIETQTQGRGVSG